MNKYKCYSCVQIYEAINMSAVCLCGYDDDNIFRGICKECKNIKINEWQTAPVGDGHMMLPVYSNDEERHEALLENIERVKKGMEGFDLLRE
jgi:hypothetical protein